MSILLKLRAKVAQAQAVSTKLNRARRRKKSQRAEFYQAFWSQAAHAVGASAQSTPEGFVLIQRDTETTRFWDNYTELDGPVTLRIAGHKGLVREILQKHDVPVAPGLIFSLDRVDRAIDFLKTHDACVVKPAAGSSAGAGVCTNIRTPKHLTQAACAAAAHGAPLLIERQIIGRDIRVLLLDGQVLDVVERRPPSVIGDGRTTIAQLVHAANQQRLQAGIAHSQVLISKSWELHRCLASQGYSWKSVPPKGKSVRLKSAVNDNAAEDNIPVRDSTPDSLIELARAAADALQVRLAGVDLMVPNPDDSSDQPVVLEVNTTPGMYIHRGPNEAKVGAAIVEACLAQNQIARAQAAHSLTGAS